MDDNERLLQYINAHLSGDDQAVLDMDAISPEGAALAQGIHALMEAVLETKSFATSLANGKLDVQPNRRNTLLGPLKDLQSNLRHMLWQVSCVSQGDFTQSVLFLGDFSVVFNALAEQIKLREQAQLRNAEIKKDIVEQKNRMLTEQLNQQIAHYQSLREMHQQLRGFRHDMKNHFLCLNRLLLAGEVEQACEYINSMSCILTQNDGMITTQNPLFDAIVSDKIGVAREKGITVETNISLPEEVSVNNFDWCIMLGNAFDNAIEACLRLPEDRPKNIWFKVNYHKGMLNLMLRNTALPPKITGDGTSYVTAKEDSQNHGMGLANIQQTVEKYDGVLQKNFKDGLFTLTFMLCGV